MGAFPFVKLTGGLRLIAVIFLLMTASFAAHAQQATPPSPATPPSISQEDMDKIVKAARDAVIRELATPQKKSEVEAPAAPVSSTKMEDGFEADVEEEGSTLYHEFKNALLSLHTVPGAVAGMIATAWRGQNSAGTPGSSLIMLAIGTLIAGAAAAFLVKNILSRWLITPGEEKLPANLATVIKAAAVLLAAWFVFWLICDVAATFWFRANDDSSSLGRWLLWMPPRIALYVTIFEIFFRPRHPALRLVPLDDKDARLAKFFFDVNAVIMVGRTWILNLSEDLTPKETLSAGLLLNNMIFVVATFWTAAYCRTAIANWIKKDATDDDISPIRQFFADNWIALMAPFIIAISVAHLVGALAGRVEVTMALSTTLRIVLIVIFASALIGYLRPRLSKGGVGTLPGSSIWAALVTPVGHVLRMLIVLGSIYWLAWLWLVQSTAVIEEARWLQTESHLVEPVLVIIGGYLLWTTIKFLTDRYLVRHTVTPEQAHDQTLVQNSSRLNTLIPLFRLALGIGLFIVVTLVVLSSLGINIAPLLAGASVAGLAISFGSQALVKDIVSGIFFLADDAFRVGEYISCGKAKGTVEGFTLRSVRLRHQSGQLHTVPFGQLGEITNFSRDWSVVKFRINFDRNVEIDKVRAIVKDVGKKLMADPEYASLLLEPLKFQGISDITDSAVVLTFKFMAKPGNPSAVEREAKRQLLYRFRQEGIKLATQSYPSTTPATT